MLVFLFFFLNNPFDKQPYEYQLNYPVDSDVLQSKLVVQDDHYSSIFELALLGYCLQEADLEGNQGKTSEKK